MLQDKTNPSALAHNSANKHFPIEVLQDYRGRTSNSRIGACKLRSQEWKPRGRESSTPYNLQLHFFCLFSAHQTDRFYSTGGIIKGNSRAYVMIWLL